MGFLDRFRRPKVVEAAVDQLPQKRNEKIITGAKDDNDTINYQSFTNSNITFNGNLTGYDYDSILRDKQRNIVKLYQLADYYCDADPIIRGIIRHVYVPYTIGSQWTLTGTNEKTNKIYENYYKRIRLREKLESIAIEYWKYSNVFVYIMHGVPVTLPVHLCKIGNTMLNGDPIVDFDCQTILNEWRQKSYTVKDNWIKDGNLEHYFEGYPPEVFEALNKGEQYAQLNPKYTKVLQSPKEGWLRYAIPFIAACLPALAKKELISKYENAILNLGIRSFVHVAYGDKQKGRDILPDITELRDVRNVFSNAMSKFPLAVTNQLAEPHVVQPKLDDLFQFDKYRDVNNDILSAGGISGIIVNGISEDGSTFASAQISMQTASARIDAARDEICELMNKINVCIQEELAQTHVYNVNQVPIFQFMPLDMAGKKAMRETCKDLWLQGLVSTKTMMETHGYSLEKETTQRSKESEDGTDDILIPRNAMVQAQQETNSSPGADNVEVKKEGRPKMTDEERNSDPDAAERSKHPKPSNPDGSMDDEA